MPMYDRSAATDARVIDRWPDGVGWLAHPDEDGHRASHAIRDDADDVWVLDPLDAPGVDDHLADLAGPDGTVAGVVVCSDYHARDAAAIALRHDVAVHVPTFCDRAASKVDAPVERFEGQIADCTVRHFRPLRSWNEAVLYRERDGLLYVPDFLSPVGKFAVGDDRLGMPTASRLFPPRGRFADLAPERICFGHGEGIATDATAALDEAMANARRHLPRALLSNLPGELRAMLGAVR